MSVVVIVCGCVCACVRVRLCGWLHVGVCVSFVFAWAICCRYCGPPRGLFASIMSTPQRYEHRPPPLARASTTSSHHHPGIPSLCRHSLLPKRWNPDMESMELLGARLPYRMSVLLRLSAGRQDLRRHLLHKHPAHRPVHQRPSESDPDCLHHRGKGGDAGMMTQPLFNKDVNYKQMVRHRVRERQVTCCACDGSRHA